jgi:hypothetical protein
MLKGAGRFCSNSHNGLIPTCARGEFHPVFGPRDGDVVVLEYWGQSGFANTAQYRLIRQQKPIANWQFETEFLEVDLEACAFMIG